MKAPPSRKISLQLGIWASNGLNRAVFLDPKGLLLLQKRWSTAAPNLGFSPRQTGFNSHRIVSSGKYMKYLPGEPQGLKPVIGYHLCMLSFLVRCIRHDLVIVLLNQCKKTWNIRPIPLGKHLKLFSNILLTGTVFDHGMQF